MVVGKCPTGEAAAAAAPLPLRVLLLLEDEVPVVLVAALLQQRPEDAAGQGLTLLPTSAQLEPFLIQNTP